MNVEMDALKDLIDDRIRNQNVEQYLLGSSRGPNMVYAELCMLYVKRLEELLRNVDDSNSADNTILNDELLVKYKVTMDTLVEIYSDGIKLTNPHTRLNV